MRHSTNNQQGEMRDSQQIINCDYLLGMFNTCNDLDTFTNHVIPENLKENESLKEQSEKIFKVLSHIAGGDDKPLTDEQKEKLEESGFFMKLVDKLLELIYSAAEKVMSWTCYSAARNRSASFIKSLEDERTKLELGLREVMVCS